MKFYPPLRDLHPSHTITRDGADDMTTWHRCAVCGATDAAGDGRLAEPCSASANEPDAAPAPMEIAIKIWRWQDAPQELRDLSEHGSDEDYVVEVPPQIETLPFLDEFDVCSDWLGDGEISEHPHPTKPGWVVFIGAHA